MSLPRQRLLVDFLQSCMNYSLEKAQEFGWASTGNYLPPERVGHLETYLTGRKILEAGCGGGGYVDFLCRQGLEATGLDMHWEFLKSARAHGRLGSYVLGDITNLPFRDKSFDSTFCFDVLEHVDDKQAVGELARVTSKRLILAVPRKDEIMGTFGLTFFPYRDPTHLRYYTETDLEALIATINCRKFTIFAEAFIPTQALINYLIDFDNMNSIIPLRGPLSFLKSSNSSLKNMLTKFSSAMLRRILDRNTTYRSISTGLAAVVEL